MTRTDQLSQTPSGSSITCGNLPSDICRDAGIKLGHPLLVLGLLALDILAGVAEETSHIGLSSQSKAIEIEKAVCKTVPTDSGAIGGT